MAYRLYRRDPVSKGEWYHTLKCKGCGLTMYVLDDDSGGKVPLNIVGDGELSVPCNRCAHEGLYPATGMRTMQADEDLDGSRPPRVAISKSPRKPLWKAYPKARATLGVGYIEDRPAAAAIVGRIITSWADLEVQCARLLAELMGTNIPAAAAVFGSLKSSRIQHDALSAAAEAVLDERDFELFAAHMSRRASLEKERNDLAHGCFGVSVAIPDHIIWVAQGDYLAFTAGGFTLEDFRKKQFVYELGTLERIAQEIAEFYHQLGSYTGYLSARARGANAFRAERYPQLCSQPHIRQALDQIRTGKKAQQVRPKETPANQRH